MTDGISPDIKRAYIRATTTASDRTRRIRDLIGEE